jgi:thioredoxin 1
MTTNNSMFRALLLTIVVFAVVCLSGIAMASAQEAVRPFNPPVSLSSSPAITQSTIDSALKSGPVFVEFETKECGYCKKQKPISQELSSDYSGKVTFFFVDASDNHDLARAYGVSSVPQMLVIARKDSSGYTYVGPDGKTSSSSSDSKFLGLTDKDRLKTAIDGALSLRK